LHAPGQKLYCATDISIQKYVENYITLHNNSATQYGGAVYVEDSHLITFCASNISTWDKCLGHADRVY